MQLIERPAGGGNGDRCRIVVQHLPASQRRAGVDPNGAIVVKLIQTIAGHDRDGSGVVVQHLPTGQRRTRVNPDGSVIVQLIQLAARRRNCAGARVVIQHLPPRQRWPGVQPNGSVAMHLVQARRERVIGGDLQPLHRSEQISIRRCLSRERLVVRRKRGASSQDDLRSSETERPHPVDVNNRAACRLGFADPVWEAGRCPGWSCDAPTRHCARRCIRCQVARQSLAIAVTTSPSFALRPHERL